MNNTLDKIIEKIIIAIFSIPVIALAVIGLIWIDGPGAPEFFAQNPVFKWVYYITHFFWGEGLFLIHIGA